MKPSNEALNKVGKVKALGWPNGNQSTHLCDCIKRPISLNLDVRYLRNMDTKEGGSRMWVPLTMVKNKHDRNGIVTK